MSCRVKSSHILGNNQSLITDVLTKATGLNNSQIGKLMISLAPMVLAAIGRARNQQGLDTAGVGTLLKNTVNSQTNQKQEMGILQRILDSNGDGSVLDDIANMGMKFLVSRG